MTLMRFKIQPVILYFDSQPPFLSYGYTILAVAAAATATCYIPVISERAVFLLFIFVIIQTAFWIGRNPALVAMMLSLIAANGLILFPAWHSAPYDTLILNIGFSLLAAFIIATTALSRHLTATQRQQQQDLSHAQAIGHIGSWRLDVQRNELHWSDENHRIFGIPKGTPMTYQTFLSTVHPDDREYVNLKWQAALRGEPYDIEHRLIVAGKIKWVRERAELEFAKNEMLLGGFGTTEDITERKRYEQELQENRQRYAEIVESAMDAVITIDANQCILVFNAAAEKMFGCSEDQAIGGSLERFIPERFRFGRTGSNRLNMNFLGAITGLRTNGEEFPIEASISQSELDGEKSFTAILRDITERQRGEVALQNQLKLQDQLAKVTESVPGLICSFRMRPDGSSCMPYASSVIESIYGFEQKAVAEDFSPVFARIHIDDIGHVNDTVSESARTLLPWRDTFRYDHPVKGERWIEGYSIPQREIDGGTLWHGYIQDITERKQAEVELQERTARYELVLEGAQDAIWDWDVLNKRVNYSPRWKALRGLAESEAGDHEEEWTTTIHPDDRERVLTAIQAHFNGITPVFCEEYQIRCKDGSLKWILDRGIAQRDSYGQVIRMAGSESDITARKHAEAALRNTENELRLIMDATPALISYLDTDFRYLRVNKTYEYWFGQSQESIFGREVREIIGEKAWHTVFRYLEKARSGERVSYDYQIQYRTGKPRWVHGNYIPDKDPNGITRGIVVHIVDIDKHKLAEQALRESQKENEFLASLIRSSSQPVGVKYPDGRIGLVNTAFEELTGYAVEELQRLNWATSLTPPEWREIERNKLAELQRTGQPVRYEKEYIRKNGSRVPIELLVQLVSDLEGTQQFYYAFLTDLTERKKAEAALQASEERLALGIQVAGLALMEVDYATDLSHLTVEAARLLGLGETAMTVPRALIHAAFHPDDQNELMRRIAESLDPMGDGSFAIDHRVVLPNVTVRWLRARQQVFFSEENGLRKPMRATLAIHDITAEKTAAEALHNSQARLALVIEEVKAGYWDWDLMTNTLYLSSEWKRQLGLDGNGLLVQWDQNEDRLHPDDRALVMAASKDFIAGRLPVYELEFRLRHKNGTYRWIHSRGALLRDPKNHPVRMMGINLDITDYKKTKELHQRHEQMEQAFRLHIAIQTAAAIAHELNQPLTAISSYADVALQLLKTGNQNPQKLTHVLENCALQAQRAGQVIRQLLSLLHKGEMIIEPIDINNSIYEASDYVKNDIQFGAFSIELALTADLPSVAANSLQIQKVLINLLRNSLESMQDSGRAAERLIVTTRRSANNPALAQVTVSDSGKGVADTATLTKMFHPFYTTKATGLGMGLAISRTLIEAHGGKMWAEQNAGNGISIHFTLPFAI